MLILEKRRCTGATTMKRFGRRIGSQGMTFLRGASLMGITVAFAFALAPSTPTRAQTPPQNTSKVPPTYEFDVATFKPNQGTDPRTNQILTVGGMRFSEDTFRARNTQLRQLIQWSYGLLGRLDDVVLGGPKWLDTDRYDITAKMDTSVADQLKKLRPDG